MSDLVAQKEQTHPEPEGSSYRNRLQEKHPGLIFISYHLIADIYVIPHINE
jgi:hypothetical protein